MGVGRESAYGGRALNKQASMRTLAPPKEHRAAVKMGGRKGNEQGDIFPRKSAP